MLPLHDTIPSAHPARITRLLIGANVLLFLFEFVLPDDSLNRMFLLYGVVPKRITDPEWARWSGFPATAPLSLFTSMFLHGGFFHLITNMWTLWIFGDSVEDRMGSVRYLLFYVLCGVGAMGLHTITNWSSTVPAIGASGAIAGVLGAYFLMFPRSVVLTIVPIFAFIPVPVPAFVFLLFWFGSQIVYGAAAMVSNDGGGGVAWWAHIGGFLAGMYLYRFFLSKKRMAAAHFEMARKGRKRSFR